MNTNKYKVSVLVDGNFSFNVTVEAMDKTGAVRAALMEIAADWDADTPDHTTKIEVTSVKLLTSDDAASLPKHPRPIDATARY